MNEEFSTALTLLSVGMISVFAVLALIVIFGNTLISIANRVIPEVKMIADKEPLETIDPRKLAAIVSAVDIATMGKAKVTSIKKAEETN